MYDGMRLYKAIVVSSFSNSGDVYVKIPSLLGPSNAVALSKTTLSKIGSTWLVPAVGAQVLVAVEDTALSNVYLVDSPTADVSSKVDAKGDLLVGTADNTVARLPIGTNGQIVIADSSQTTGIKWVQAGQVPVYTITSSASNVSLNLTHTGALIRSTATGSVSISVPLASSINFTVGTQITIFQEGTGLVTVTPVSGVTVRATPGYKLRTQYSVATLVKVESNTWVLFGDLVL